MMVRWRTDRSIRLRSIAGMDAAMTAQIKAVRQVPC